MPIKIKGQIRKNMDLGPKWTEKSNLGPYHACREENCPCPASWNGQKDEACCRTCRSTGDCKEARHFVPFTRPPETVAPCRRPDCPCPASWNGQPDQYCGKSCRSNGPCPRPISPRKATAGPTLSTCRATPNKQTTPRPSRANPGKTWLRIQPIHSK